MKEEPKKKAFAIRCSQRMQALLKPPMQNRHIYEVEISGRSDAKVNNPTYEDEEVDHNDNKKDGNEEGMILKTTKVVPKRSKPSSKSKGDRGTKQKHAHSNAYAASVGEKTTSSA